MFIVSAPLHPYRRTDGLREQRGIARGVLGPVAAVAARTLDIDAAHFLWRSSSAIMAELLDEVVRGLGLAVQQVSLTIL